MSDGDFRRPPMLWEQRLAQRVDVATVGLGVSAAYEVSPEVPPGDGGVGTDPPVETPRPDDFSKPSTPVVTGTLQGIRAVWNGLTASGNPFPIETAWIEVHLSTSGTAFTPGTATLKGQLYDPGEFLIGGLTAGTTYYVKFRGADAAGSVTDASDAASGQTGLTTENDYGVGTIGSASVSFDARAIGGRTNTVGSAAPVNPLEGDVWLDSSPGTAIIHKIYSGGSWTTNAWGSASIAAGQITALQIAAGAITAGAIQADAINGKTIVGATVKTAGTVGPTGYPGVVIDTSGLKAYNSTGGTTVDISAATGNVTISGYLTQADVGSGGSTNIDGGRITTGTISANRLDLSGVLTATSVGSGGTTQIDGGRITTGTISAARLDLTGRLTATDVGSSGSTVIDGGRITSGTISGRVVRTSGGGSRIVLADAGADTIGFYSGGTVVATVKADPNQFVFDVSSGSEVKVSGKLQVNSNSNFDAAMTTKNITATGNIECTGDMTVGDELFADRITVEGDYVILNAYRTTTNAADTALRIRSNVTTTNQAKFEVAANGDVFSRTNSYAGFSDARLKENVTPARNYLDDLRQIEIVNFNWIDDDYKMLGVIAQQVQTVFPTMVVENEEGDLGVRYSVFVPMLITAVQSLADKVDDLTARIEALEG